MPGFDGAHNDVGPPTSESAARKFWWVHGDAHDLEAFVSSHPGGKLAIRLGQGIDCTELFMSYHVANGRAQEVLDQYRVGPRKKPLPDPSPLKLDLELMVRRHFGPGRSAHKPTTTHLLMCAALWLANVVCWVGWFYCSIPALLALPFIGWLAAVNTSHDASHFAFSSRPLVNFLVIFTALPLQYNPMTWYYQHVISHHNHCNDPSHDVDLMHFAPMKLHPRDTAPTPHGDRTPFDYLKTLLVPLHLVFAVPLACMGYGIDTATYAAHFPVAIWMPPGLKAHLKYRLCNLAGPASFIPVVFLPLRSCYLSGLSATMAAVFILYPMAVASLCFIIGTQVSHIQPEVQTAEMITPADSYARNCLSSCDYGTDSHFWSIMTGGLNAQAIHHSLPYINSCHYTALYPEFEAVCKRHGHTIVKRRNLWHAVCTSCQYVWKINRSTEQVRSLLPSLQKFM